jgi:uncharacterized protein (TIGR00251 family)
LVFTVRVIPRSPKSAITGRRGDAIVVRLSAPPVDDAANKALIELLSKAFERPRRDVSIVSGHKSRDKRVAVEGISEQDLSARLTALLEAGR